MSYGARVAACAARRAHVPGRRACRATGSVVRPPMRPDAVTSPTPDGAPVPAAAPSVLARLFRSRGAWVRVVLPEAPG